MRNERERGGRWGRKLSERLNGEVGEPLPNGLARCIPEQQPVATIQPSVAPESL